MNDFEYQIIRRPRRKTASISVKPDGTVRILVPDTLPEAKVVELVERKSRWIQSKLSHFEAIQCSQPKREYVSGEFFTYLGRNYRLKVVLDDTDEAAKLMNGRFYVPVPAAIPGKTQEQQIVDRLSSWYQKHAPIRLREKVDRYAKQMNVSPRSVGIKGYKSRWGSCHSDGRLYFNWRIIIAPHSVVDYVVVHELCHLVHGNHSKKFWRLVESILPDYAERTEWLRLNGRGLRI